MCNILMVSEHLLVEYFGIQIKIKMHRFKTNRLFTTLGISNNVMLLKYYFEISPLLE